MQARNVEEIQLEHESYVRNPRLGGAEIFLLFFTASGLRVGGTGDEVCFTSEFRDATWGRGWNGDVPEKCLLCELGLDRHALVRGMQSL